MNTFNIAQNPTLTINSGNFYRTVVIQNIKSNADGTLNSLLVVGKVFVENNDADSLALAKEKTLDDARKSLSVFLNQQVIFTKETKQETAVNVSDGKESAVFREITKEESSEYSQAAIIGLKPIFRQFKDGQYVIIYGWKAEDCPQLTGISCRLSPDAAKRYSISVGRNNPSIPASEQEFAVKNARIHPVIRDAFLANPLLFEGGSLLVRQKNGAGYILIGVGRGSLSKNNLEKARLIAESNADIELASILNPVLTECSKNVSATTTIQNDDAVFKEHTKECFRSLLKTFQSGIESGGFWFADDRSAVYFVRMCLVGDIIMPEIIQKSCWLHNCSDVKWKDDQEAKWKDILEKHFWLIAGGVSFVSGTDQKKYLMIISSCASSVPRLKAEKVMRLRAEKYVSSFLKGTKLTQIIDSICEYYVVNDKATAEEWRKNQAWLASAARLNELEPIASWTVPRQNLQFCCFVYPLPHKN